LEVKVLVDGDDIPLNGFVNKILAGTFVGAVTSLRGIRKDWKKIKIEITQSPHENEENVKAHSL